MTNGSTVVIKFGVYSLLGDWFHLQLREKTYGSIVKKKGMCGFFNVPLVACWFFVLFLGSRAGETNDVNAVHFLFSLKRCIYRLFCFAVCHGIGLVNFYVLFSVSLASERTSYFSATQKVESIVQSVITNYHEDSW